MSKIILCVLDGWGIGDEADEYNAIAKAQTPNYNELLKKFSNSRIDTSGNAVGLPEGQMGNSEVGHMTMGAGRVIFQDFERINLAIKTGEIDEKLKSVINGAKKYHLIGLLSDGGVHSHENHVIYLAKFLALRGIEVNFHAILDGRDTDQVSCGKYIAKFMKETKDFSNIKIATISGRYYAMDRDKRWERVELFYDAITSGKSEVYFVNPIECFADGSHDEFVKPAIMKGYSGMNDGDGLLVANFRADRMKQICSALVCEDFQGFERKKLVKFHGKFGMIKYSDEISRNMGVIFSRDIVKNSLGEILSANGFKQLRIAETEKYAHVTFFFSCGMETEFDGEERILVQSPKVATYDLQPEMSANELAEILAKKIAESRYDFILVNFANPDMVGHSGVFEAAKRAVENIDKNLGILTESVLKNGYDMIITADHGNVECMIDENSHPHTSHTTNLVPFILVSNRDVTKLRDGTLADIAPTILELMDMKQPQEMTGKSLII